MKSPTGICRTCGRAPRLIAKKGHVRGCPGQRLSRQRKYIRGRVETGKCGCGCKAKRDRKPDGTLYYYAKACRLGRNAERRERRLKSSGRSRQSRGTRRASSAR